MDVIVLCTIQKKKQRQQQQQQQSKEACKVGETKKRAINSKAKGKGQDAGGRKKRKRTAAEPQEEDHAQRTPTETEAVVQEQASTRVPDFTVDWSPAALPPPPPPQETIMAAAAGGDNDNYISVHSSFAATMSSSSQFQFQAPPFAQGFLPCILAPLGGGDSCSIMSPDITWMDLQTEPPPPPPPEELPKASWIFPTHTRHNAAKTAPSVHRHGFGPCLSSSSYRFAGGDTHRLSAGTGTGYHDLPRLSFPSQPSYGVGGGSKA